MCVTGPSSTQISNNTMCDSKENKPKQATVIILSVWSQVEAFAEKFGHDLDWLERIWKRGKEAGGVVVDINPKSVSWMPFNEVYGPNGVTYYKRLGYRIFSSLTAYNVWEQENTIRFETKDFIFAGRNLLDAEIRFKVEESDRKHPFHGGFMIYEDLANILGQLELIELYVDSKKGQGN